MCEVTIVSGWIVFGAEVLCIVMIISFLIAVIIDKFGKK
jgi:hypothetical protein